MKRRIALFIPAPPEHNAHVINSVSLYSGLTEAYPEIEFVWITMNPRDPSLILNPSKHLQTLGLEEYQSICDVEVLNCAHRIKDEFSPQPAELKEFIESLNCSSLYMHFYPPFWEPVRQVCTQLHMSFGLHVKVFYRKPGLPFYFQHDPQALTALKHIDYLSVSQEQDRVELHQTFGIDPDKVIILPKSVPQVLLAKARQFATSLQVSQFLDRFAPLKPSLTSSEVRLGYIGRFEELKNIVWFLETCMPALRDLETHFHLTLVGTGSLQADVVRLAQQYPNVTLLTQTLGYQDTLCLLTQLDLVLYPSGFDFAPRLPLESLLVGTPCLLTDVHFNHRYRPYALMVESQEDRITHIAYNGAEICYALPDSQAVIAALRTFIQDRQPYSRAASSQLDEESNPLYAARVLMERINSL